MMMRKMCVTCHNTHPPLPFHFDTAFLLSIVAALGRPPPLPRVFLTVSRIFTAKTTVSHVTNLTHISWRSPIVCSPTHTRRRTWLG